MIQSPLNYTGGKYRLLPQLLPYFPETINTFVDLFCGGCNVGINISAKKHIYNDICPPLIGLYNTMKTLNKDFFVSRVQEIILKYDLSDVKTFGYDYYGCSSSDGLSSYNKEKYLLLRTDLNRIKDDQSTDYYIMLYVLIVFAFNNQIRFNRKGEFNLPPGKRDFNTKMFQKLNDFIDVIQTQKATFLNMDYNQLSFDKLNENDMVYVDPPYLITLASYNEQNGWSTMDEVNLLSLLDKLNNQHVKFALSNVLMSKGKVNTILSDWLSQRPRYKVINLDYSYKNSNYQRKNKLSETREVLIVNY